MCVCVCVCVCVAGGGGGGGGHGPPGPPVVTPLETNEFIGLSKGHIKLIIFYFK